MAGLFLLVHSVKNMSGHADALVACDRGVQQAEEDFARGRHSVNPFPSSAPLQRAGWDGRMRALVCQRDHGINLCCQEHHQHKSPTLRSCRNLSCCAECSAEMTPHMDAEHSQPAREGNAPGTSPCWSPLKIPQPRAPQDVRLSSPGI